MCDYLPNRFFFGHPLFLKKALSHMLLLFHWRCVYLGGCCGWQKCLPDVPAMSWRSSFLCQNKTEVTGAKCASSLQANRLCCSWSTLQRNRATGSQIKKVCLHWWVKVGTFYFMFLSNTKNACVYLRQL